MERWGTELWDRWDAVVEQVSAGTQEMAAVYARFLNDRARVERTYAKGLRDLIKSYSPAVNKKELEEPSQTTEFRHLLKELGFQAGQHEVMEEACGKTAQTSVNKKVKEVKSEIEKSKKEARELERKINASFKSLKDKKARYNTAHSAMEFASDSFKKTSENGNASRNEIEQAKSIMDRKNQECLDLKATYASQVVQTNRDKDDYYFTALPAILNRLQDMHMENAKFITAEISGCITVEQERRSIITKCHCQMQVILARVDLEADSQLITERLKSGNVPPDEFLFEELRIGEGRPLSEQAKGLRADITSVRDISKLGNGPPPYQKKRVLEQKIRVQEEIVRKGQKEVGALQVMVKSHTDTPAFGNTKKLKGELETASHKVSLEESKLLGLKNELSEVTRHMGTRDRRSTSTTPHSPSTSHGSINSSSPADSGIFPSVKEERKDSFIDNLPESPTPPPPPVFAKPPSSTSTAPESPLPPPPSAEPMAEAMFDYLGDEECLGMVTGEQFLVLAPDLDGWTHVRRPGDGEEGFVPSSYLNLL